MIIILQVSLLTSRQSWVRVAAEDTDRRSLRLNIVLYYLKVMIWIIVLSSITSDDVDGYKQQSVAESTNVHWVLTPRGNYINEADIYTLKYNLYFEYK